MKRFDQWKLKSRYNILNFNYKIFIAKWFILLKVYILYLQPSNSNNFYWSAAGSEPPWSRDARGRRIHHLVRSPGVTLFKILLVQGWQACQRDKIHSVSNISFTYKQWKKISTIYWKFIYSSDYKILISYHKTPYNFLLWYI